MSGKEGAFWLLYFVALHIITSTNASTCKQGCENKENMLVHQLLKDYNKEVRPVQYHDHTIELRFDLALKQIIDVDERNQLLKINAWVRQYWNDYYLRWNITKYGGVKSIEVDSSKIWLPDVTLANNAQEKFYGFDKTTENRVIVYADGSVVWLTPVILQTECRIDILYFPFDQQKCPLHFMSWAMDGKKLNITAYREEGDASSTSPNGEWILESFSMERKVERYNCCPNPYPSLLFTITIRRRSLYYIFNLIVPSILLSFLAITSFFVPAESGERTSLVITNLLTLTVFMLIISSTIPATSEVVPILGKFLTVVMVVMGLALAVTCLVIRYSFNLEEPSDFVKKYINRYLAKLLFFSDFEQDILDIRRRKTPLQDGLEEVVLKNILTNQRIKNQERHAIQNSENGKVYITSKEDVFKGKVINELKILSKKAAVDTEKEKISAEWKRTSLVLDRLFSIIFLIMILGAIIWLFLAPPNIAL